MAERSNTRGNTKAKKKDSLSIKVVIGPCRISFPHFFEPAETDNGDRYQANFLFPPNWKKQPDYKKFMDALWDVTEDEFGPESDWPSSKQNRWPDEVVRKAEEKDYAGYKPGWFFIKAASRDPIGIVDANREEVTNPREVYGGRWARISVTVKAYDNKSKGVGVYLNSVQVLDHDEQFGGRGPAKNDFEDWEGDSLSEDDRGTGRGNARERDDEDRGRGRDRDDERGSDRGRSDRDGARGSRGRSEDTDRDDDGRGRSRGRDDDERGSRGRRDADDGGSRGRGRGDDEDRPARGRVREDEDDVGRGDTRGLDRNGSSRGGSRGRDLDEDRGSSRRSTREEDDAGERGSGRTSRRDDDEPRRGRSREDDEPAERGRSSRGRDAEDDEPRGRGGRGSRDERDWN